MTISVFDLTEHTQLAVRRNTGCHPDGLSLGVCISSTPIHHDANKDPLDLSAYDAVDWDRALRMAAWILKVDEGFNEEPHRHYAELIDQEDGKVMDTSILPIHPCPFCGFKRLFAVKNRTNVYCADVNQVEAVLRCHGCGSSVQAFGNDFDSAKHVALAKWETRP